MVCYKPEAFIVKGFSEKIDRAKKLDYTIEQVNDSIEEHAERLDRYAGFALALGSGRA